MIFTKAAVRSKTVDLLLVTHCLLSLPMVVGVLCLALFCCAVLSVLSSFTSLDEEERAGYFTFIVFLAVIVLWPFLTVLWVGLQCVIVVFLDHTHFSAI